MGRLDGKIALVTGGNSGIGLATAKRFVAEGATVYVTGRRQDALDAAVAEIGPGAVVLNGSIVSVKGTESFGVYNATKAAVRSLARTWTAELKGAGIRVNVVSPGPISTPGMENLTSDPDALKAALTAAVPMGRLGDPDEIAKAVVFLATDESSYVAGVELFVDGGAAQV